VHIQIYLLMVSEHLVHRRIQKIQLTAHYHQLLQNDLIGLFALMH